MNNNIKKIIILAVLVLVIGAGAFYGGVKYSQSKALSQRQQLFQSQANMAANFQRGISGRGIAGSNFIGGEVINKDEQSITLKIQDGSSKIIFFSDATAILKTEEGNIEDIDIGQQIVITGQENSDGSYTAQTIQGRESLFRNDSR